MLQLIRLVSWHLRVLCKNGLWTHCARASSFSVSTDSSHLALCARVLTLCSSKSCWSFKRSLYLANCIAPSGVRPPINLKKKTTSSTQIKSSKKTKKKQPKTLPSVRCMNPLWSFNAPWIVPQTNSAVLCWKTLHCWFISDMSKLKQRRWRENEQFRGWIAADLWPILLHGPLHLHEKDDE